MSGSLPSYPRKVVLLGATGSIGESALRVIAAHPEHLELVAIAARSNHTQLAAIAQAHPRVRHAAIFEEGAYAAARSAQDFPAHVNLHAGLDGLITLATLAEADIVLVAVVGVTGLEPALAAIPAGKDLALASKEILVMAGKFVMAAARDNVNHMAEALAADGRRLRQEAITEEIVELAAGLQALRATERAVT